MRSLPEDLSCSVCNMVYAAIVPGADYTIERATPYRMHQRSAPRYRVGRVALVGDAAHVTNPTGGLGLTSGLFDSFALYPALAAVISDGADAPLLDRYSDSRRDIFLNLISPQAIANKRLIYHANGGGPHSRRRWYRCDASDRQGLRVTATDVPEVARDAAPGWKLRVYTRADYERLVE